MRISHIKSITSLDTSFTRYDLEIQDNHNFFANGVLVHNCASTFSWDGKSYKVYSHNFEVNSGNWVEVSNIYDIENKIKSYCKREGLKGLALQGEVCGPGIQGNIYGFNTLKLFLYGGFHDDGTRLKYSELKEISKFMLIDLCPEIYKNIKISNFSGLDEIINLSDGESVFKNNGKPVLREGLVWRTEDGKVHWKNKSRLYKVKVSEKINESEEAN